MSHLLRVAGVTGAGSDAVLWPPDSGAPAGRRSKRKLEDLGQEGQTDEKPNERTEEGAEEVPTGRWAQHRHLAASVVDGVGYSIPEPGVRLVGTRICLGADQSTAIDADTRYGPASSQPPLRPSPDQRRDGHHIITLLDSDDGSSDGELELEANRPRSNASCIGSMLHEVDLSTTQCDESGLHGWQAGHSVNSAIHVHQYDSVSDDDSSIGQSDFGHPLTRGGGLPAGVHSQVPAPIAAEVAPGRHAAGLQTDSAR